MRALTSVGRARVPRQRALPQLPRKACVRLLSLVPPLLPQLYDTRLRDAHVAGRARCHFFTPGCDPASWRELDATTEQRAHALAGELARSKITGFQAGMGRRGASSACSASRAALRCTPAPVHLHPRPPHTHTHSHPAPPVPPTLGLLLILLCMMLAHACLAPTCRPRRGC